MGNYRFRFSWFNNSNKITKTQPVTTSSSYSSVSSPPSLFQPAVDQRKSYYFTRDLTVPDPTTHIDPSPPEAHPPDSRRKSTKKKRPTSPKKPTLRKLKSSELHPNAGCSCRSLPESKYSDNDNETNSLNEFVKLVPEYQNPDIPEQVTICSCKTNSLNDDVYGKVDLPRIITKPAKENEFGSGKWVIDGGSRSLSVRVVKEGITGSPVRKVKGNGYSPRLGNRVKVNGINGGRRRAGSRRSLSESLAVVKTTVDPGRDFKESMVEMIMENNIKSSKDLEDLLACYLALNSDEYHDLIIKVFKQIWFESTDIRL